MLAATELGLSWNATLSTSAMLLQTPSLTRLAPASTDLRSATPAVHSKQVTASAAFHVAVCLVDVSEFRSAVSGTSPHPCFAHMHKETALEHMRLPPECQPERLPNCGNTHVYASAITALAVRLAVRALACLLRLSMEDLRTCIQKDRSTCGCCEGLRLTETAHTLPLLHALHHVFDTLGHIADPWPVRCTAALRLLWRAWDEWSRWRPGFGGPLR